MPRQSSLFSHISGRLSRSAISFVIGAQTYPEVLRTIQATHSWLADSAAMITSPSFSLESAAQPAFEVSGGSENLLNLRRLAPLPILMLGAFAALEHENWTALRGFVLDPQIQADGCSGPFIGAAHPGLVFRDAEIAETVLARSIAGQETDNELYRYRSRGGLRFTAMSDTLHQVLRGQFEYDFPIEKAYDAAFDQTEIFLALVAEDAHIVQAEAGVRSGPYMFGCWIGRFTWRNRHHPESIEEAFMKGARADGDHWGPLTAGFFGGKASRLEASYSAFAERTRNARNQQH